MGNKLRHEGDEVRIKVIWPDNMSDTPQHHLGGLIFKSTRHLTISYLVYIPLARLSQTYQLIPTFSVQPMW